MRRLSPNGEPIPETLLKMDRDIVDRVVAEILETPTTIKWETIAGLEHAKAAVQELAVWPLMKPELFRGAPPCGAGFCFSARRARARPSSGARWRRSAARRSSPSAHLA